MPIITKVSDLVQASEGFVPEGITGKLTQLWPSKVCAAGTPREGTMQSGILSGEGKTIKIIFRDREEIPKSDVGKIIYATAVMGQQKRLGGLKVDYYEEKPQIWVYKQADLSIDGGGEPNGGGEAPPQRTAAPAQQQQRPPARGTQAQRPAAAPAGGSGDAPAATSIKPVKVNGGALTPEQTLVNVKHVRKHLLREANLMLMALDASYFIRDQFEAEKGEQMAEGHFQGIATTLYIQAARDGMMDFVPKTPYTHEYKLDNKLVAPKPDAAK